MNQFFVLFLALAMWGPSLTHQAANAQGFGFAEVSFSIDPGSVISILGTSTVGSFRCESDKVIGGGRLGWEHEDTGEPFVEAMLTSLVTAFDCKNGKMTNDLHKALKYELHPDVSFSVDDGFATQATEDEETDYVLRASGLLSIAGVERRIDLHLVADRVSFLTFSLKGSEEILLTDYGIDPPTALLGLIRTGDRITIEFDLVVSPKMGF